MLSAGKRFRELTRKERTETRILQAPPLRHRSRLFVAASRTHTGSRDVTGPPQPKYSIHGRHLEVNEELHNHVTSRLNKVLSPLLGESVPVDAAVGDVDVKLMQSMVEIKIHPMKPGNGVNDTYLQRGELKALAQDGHNVYENFDHACEQLAKKLQVRAARKEAR